MEQNRPPRRRIRPGESSPRVENIRVKGSLEDLKEQLRRKLRISKREWRKGR